MRASFQTASALLRARAATTTERDRRTKSASAAILSFIHVRGESSTYDVNMELSNPFLVMCRGRGGGQPQKHPKTSHVLTTRLGKWRMRLRHWMRKEGRKAAAAADSGGRPPPSLGLGAFSEEDLFRRPCTLACTGMPSGGRTPLAC